MIYYCSNCRLILPQDQVMHSRVCSSCGKTPAIHFGTEEELLGQGYRWLASANGRPAPTRAPSGNLIEDNSDTGSKRSPRTPKDSNNSNAPKKPGNSGGNRRIDWMDEGETSAPPKAKPPKPKKPTTPLVRSDSPVPPRPATPTTGPNSVPKPPVMRSDTAQPGNSGRSPIDGNPIGGSGRNRNRSNINWPLIIRLLLLLAAVAVLGLLIYTIWSMREQIIKDLTVLFFLAILAAGAFLVFRRRRR